MGRLFTGRHHGTVKIIKGGRGSGKSWGIAIAMLIIGTSKPTRFLCAREIQKSIQQSVHQLLKDQIEEINEPWIRATILTPELIEPGMHLNAVGGDCPGKTELHAQILERAQVFVEYEPQSRVEGEIQQMPADFAVTELWEIGRAHV